MSPRVKVGVYQIDGFPRVSGDEPHVWPFQAALMLFSPRERG